MLPATPETREPRQRRARLKAEPEPGSIPARFTHGERWFGIRLASPFVAFGVAVPARYSGWTVKIVSLMSPGDTQHRQYLQLRNGPYLVKETIDPFYIRREMGDDLYAQLKEVTPR